MLENVVKRSEFGYIREKPSLVYRSDKNEVPCAVQSVLWERGALYCAIFSMRTRCLVLCNLFYENEVPCAVQSVL